MTLTRGAGPRDAGEIEREVTTDRHTTKKLINAFLADQDTCERPRAPLPMTSLETNDRRYINGTTQVGTRSRRGPGSLQCPAERVMRDRDGTTANTTGRRASGARRHDSRRDRRRGLHPVRALHGIGPLSPGARLLHGRHAAARARPIRETNWPWSSYPTSSAASSCCRDAG